jgi:hypothetical protein
MRLPKIQPPSTQWECILRLQQAHFPQIEMQETITRFLGRKAVTAVPISSTTPTPSTLVAAIPFGFMRPRSRADFVG